MTDTVHTIGDWIAASITIATILKLLPAIAALLSIAWTITRFHDRWIAKHNNANQISASSRAQYQQRLSHTKIVRPTANRPPEG